MPPSHSHSHAGPPSLTLSEGQGNSSLLYLFSRESGTISINIRAERECHHRTRKLDYQASHKGEVTVFCHTCLDSTVL